MTRRRDRNEQAVPVGMGADNRNPYTYAQDEASEMRLDGRMEALREAMEAESSIRRRSRDLENDQIDYYERYLQMRQRDEQSRPIARTPGVAREPVWLGRDRTSHEEIAAMQAAFNQFADASQEAQNLRPRSLYVGNSSSRVMATYSSTYSIAWPEGGMPGPLRGPIEQTLMIPVIQALPERAIDGSLVHLATDNQLYIFKAGRWYNVKKDLMPIAPVQVDGVSPLDKGRRIILEDTPNADEHNS
jgi:hypothetical protein